MKKVAVAMMCLIVFMYFSLLSSENASADFSLPYTYNGHQYSDVLQNFWVSYAAEWTTTIYYNIPTSGADIRFTGDSVGINCAKSAVRIMQAPQYYGGNPYIDGEWLNEEDTCGLGIGTQITVGPPVDTSKLYSSQNILETTGNNIWFYANVSRTAPSPGNIAVSPSLYNFGNLTVGACSAIPTVFTLSNTGSTNINVTDITTNLTVSNNKIFELIYDWGPKPCNQSNPTITPGDNCTVGVAFCPATAGSVTDNLIVTSNNPNSPANIQMTGTGVSTGPNLGTPPLYNESNLNMTTSNHSNFADLQYFNYYNSNHNGTDLALSTDGSATASKITLFKSVHAICDGQVIDSNFNNNSPDMTYMQVRHANCGGQDLMAYYGHITTSLANGTPIKKGDILGTVVKYTKNWNHLHLTLDVKTERNLFSINYQMCDYIYDINSRAITELSNCVYSSSRAKLPENKMMLKVGYGRVTTDRYTNSNGKKFQKSLYISESAMRQLGFISYFDLH